MRVSLNQLRRLVRESLESELVNTDPSPAVDIYAPAKYVADSLARHIKSSDSNAIFNRAAKMMSYDIEDGDLTVPAHFEDIEMLSSEAADRVLADPAVKEAIVEIVAAMYGEMMRSV